ncbi:putative beta-glucosidase [Aureobasidium pullulans]|nr:putative beta-glucosidase [Aureobasidium pullulans]
MYNLKSSVAALVLLGQGIAAQNSSWDHSLYTSSPGVFPSPNTTGIGWEDALQKAKSWVANLTLEEKVGLLTGEPKGPCIGNIAPIPRVGFPGLCLQDGPLSIRQATFASVFPAGLTAASSWDRDLIRQRGEYLGAEFRDKGAHVALAPVAGPLGRSADAGRGWEGFSPDPYLTGVAMEETIEALQEAGVQACAKHWIGNEQETQRNPTLSPTNKTIEAVSANIDDRTMHELYMWPFANAVKAGVSSMMCSYNRLNSSYACQNSKALNGLLKEELGFQGYVMSDWGATHAGVANIEAGMDMDMPGTIAFFQAGTSYYGQNLTNAVNNGTVPESRIDDAAHRIMTPYFFLGQDQDFPLIDPSSGPINILGVQPYLDSFQYGEANVDVRANHADLIRKLGSAGTILLKNTNNALPLNKPRNIAVFGNDAGDPENGLYSLSLTGNGDYEYGHLAVGGGSGTGRLTYLSTPLDALKVRAKQDGTNLQWILNNTLLANANTAAGFGAIYPQPDTCIVTIKTWAAEGNDKANLLPDYNGTQVVENVAAWCNNTIVVTHTSGPIVMPWADHPNVTAILAAHFAGQESGNSLVDVLYGEYNPSGKLPYTIAYNESDYAFARITNSTELRLTEDPNAWQADFTEGLLIDYRHYDYYNLSVQYEFGYGLSYTNFSMSDVKVQRLAPQNLTARPTNAGTMPGGNPTLYDTLYEITVKVKNTGSIAGDAVPQLYLSQPVNPSFGLTPIQVLRGFEKVALGAGQSRTVTFPLQRRDLSFWDAVQQQWIIPSGNFGVRAGFSSRDIQATSGFSAL